MLQLTARPARRLFGAKAGGSLSLPTNNDGQPVVPPPGSAVLPTPEQKAQSAAVAARLGEDAPAMANDRWTVGGFKRMRSAQPQTPPDPARPQGPLGNSMRQPFDYERALEVLRGDQRKPKAWQYALAAVGDALAMNSGYRPYAVQNLTAARNEQAQRQREAAAQVLGWQYNDYARNQEADLRAAAPFSSGRDRVQFDPATGQSRVIYDGAEDFQTYADELGLEPGSEEYFKAVEDYVLRSAGPSAYERDVQLDDHRTGNDAELERIRNGFRVGLEQLRQTNRRGMVDYRNANPAPPRPRRKASSNSVVTVKTPAEAARLPKGTRYRGPDGVVRER